jgi:hypothetical protein
MLPCPCFSPVGDSVVISKPMDALQSMHLSKGVLKRVFYVVFGGLGIAHE